MQHRYIKVNCPRALDGALLRFTLLIMSKLSKAIEIAFAAVLSVSILLCLFATFRMVLGSEMGRYFYYIHFFIIYLSWPILAFIVYYIYLAFASLNKKANLFYHKIRCANLLLLAFQIVALVSFFAVADYVPWSAPVG